jgi:putative nucleotidyltransferase with HDIG domain
MDRQAAWALLTEYTQNESLLKHALAVEAAMRACAGKFGGDPDEWGIVGLIHDFDYERFPSAEAGHAIKGPVILREQGYPAHLVRAVQSHADYSGVPRETVMEKALFACDELCGFITAAALVRPTKSVLDLEASSVRKRMKDKAFARAVNRDEIVEGAALLGMDLDAHVAFVLEAMRGIAGDLGLAGGAAPGGGNAPLRE